MKNKPTGEIVSARHFTWRLRNRRGVYFADGRACTPNLGRHSLGTKDREVALRELAQLDALKAVEAGLVDASVLASTDPNQLLLDEGRKLYMEHAGRPRVVGGVRQSSSKRYRAVFSKFLVFANESGLKCWDQVSAKTLQAYAAQLESEGYAYRTQYLELTTLKQVVRWFIRNKHLPTKNMIDLAVRKPDGSDVHCWKPEEVRAILNHCQQNPELAWLHDLLLFLALTGLRISELRDLRWSDIDLDKQMIRLVDESSSSRKANGQERRTTKGGRGRTFPIHKALLPMLAGLTRHKDGYVFHGPAGGRIKADTVRRILVRDVVKPLAEKFPTAAGEVGFADGRLHAFRHLFCSTCANQGVPQQVVMQWLGHRSSLLVAHYYHLHDEEAHRQMGRLRLFKDADGDVAGGA